MAGERGVVKGGSDDLVAKRARKGAIDGDGGLGGAHVEGLRTMGKARVDYGLLQGTDLIIGLLQGTDFHKNSTRVTTIAVKLGKKSPKSSSYYTLESYPQKTKMERTEDVRIVR